MKKLFSTIVLALTLLCGTNLYAQKNQAAIDLNDKLASITDSLYARGQEWGTQFSTVMNGDKDFKSLKQYRVSIQSFIDKKLSELHTMKDVSGSRELREAMIGFLEFEKHMIETGFAPAEKLSPSATDEQVQAMIQKLTDESKNESTVLEKVRAAQHAYAKKNGFSIESEETVEE